MTALPARPVPEVPATALPPTVLQAAAAAPQPGEYASQPVLAKAVNAPAAALQRPGLLDEVFDDLERRYKSPSPDVIALKARSFELLLHRWVLLFVGLQAGVGGLLALVRLGQLSPRSATLISLAAAAACAGLSRWGRHGDEWSRTLLLGAHAALILLAGAAQPVPWLAAVITVLLAASMAALVSAGEWPQAVVLLAAPYLPLVWLLPAAEPWLRLLAEAAAVLLMLVVFTWRQLKTAATGAMLGASAVGVMELSAAADSGRDVLAAMLGLFVFVGVAYEVRIRYATVSRWREVARIGVPVVLVYLFAGSLLLLPGWEDAEHTTWWLAAALVCAYQIVRGNADPPSFPLRLPWVALGFAWAVVADDRLDWAAQHLLLLVLVAGVQLSALHLRSGLVSGIALTLLAGAALQSLMASDERYGPNITVVAGLTFIALWLMSGRPAFSHEPGAAQHTGLSGVGLLGVARKVLLIGLALLLRLPLLAWLFHWLRIGYQWLRYFASPRQPLSFNDVVFCAAHAYGVTVMTRQAVYLCVAASGTPLAVALTWALVPAVWGVVLLAFSLHTGRIDRRMLGVALMVAPAGVQAWQADPGDGSYYAWLALLLGGLGCIASWAVLRFAKRSVR